MNKKIIFWLCILFLSKGIYSQNYLSEYQELTKTEDLTDLQKKVDSLIKLSVNANLFDEAIEISHDFSIKNYKKKNYKLAIDFGKIEVELYEKTSDINDTYVQALYNLGRFYFKNNNFDASIKVHQKIIALSFNDEKSGRSYCEIGACYFALGDYYKSVDHYKEGLSYLEKAEKYSLLIRKSLTLSNVYEQINTSKSLSAKFELLQQIIELSKHSKMRDVDYYSLYNNLASYYNNDDTFNFETSKFYQEKFLLKALSNKDSTHIVISYSNLGNLFKEVKNDSAIYYFKKALSYAKTNHSSNIRTYNNLAHYYLNIGSYNESITYAHKVLVASTGISTDVNELPKSNALFDLPDTFSMLRALSIKATAYLRLYEEDKNTTHVHNALATLKVADQLIDLVLIESSENQSKFHWRKKASSIYSKGILCSALLEEYELGFYFNEKNKALLLLEDIALHLKKLELPKDIFQKELNLKKEIYTLGYTYKGETNKTASKELQKKLFEKKLVYQKFVDSLGTIYPEYFSEQQLLNLSSLEETQNKLDDDTVIVSYNWDETDDLLHLTFGVFISKQDIKIIPLAASKELKGLVAKYRKTLHQPFQKEQDRIDFNQVSYQLYQALFPKAIQVTIKGKQLIIIPDNSLQQIPFEALLTGIDEPNYLIEEHRISYAYSMSFLHYNATIKRDLKKDYIGFSPITFRDTQLDSLAHSIKEIYAIDSLLYGQKYVRSAATKNAFLKNKDVAKIVHLATHADASSNPWIAFYDEKLQLHELYTHKSLSELVVLSACETSIGTIKQGEGSMSLTRGFFYSGAKSVVSSLWAVNDKTSVDILTEFYKGLHQGMTKDEALRNAKLNYLNSHSLSQASPYYWSSFILIGDHHEIFNKSYSNLYLIVLGIVLLLLIILFFKFRKRVLFLNKKEANL